MNPSGGGVSAWPSADGDGHEAIAIREDFPSGAIQTALLSGGGGGPVGELAVARSGLGEGLVAFVQGPLGDAAVVAVLASAPPEQFVASVPRGWIAPSQAVVSWLPAPSSRGPITYRVVLDGRPLPVAQDAFEMHIDPRRLGDGRHRVQLLATDAVGQSTLTPPSALLIDALPPSVTISSALRGVGVSVRVRDSDSGVDRRRVSVSFGDGSSARGRVRYTHRYARAGVYRVVVRARDNIGIAGVVRRLVDAR
jgi:hypothetical protein